MKCPFCDNLESKVMDSRLSKEGDITRRRRECERCGKRFTTYERLEESLPLVVKKDGRREVFDRAKIFHGIQKACEKRPVSVEKIDGVVDDIVAWAQDLGQPEITSEAVGERVMHALHALDGVAYVRFASVYRSFKDLGEFMAELKDLLAKPRNSA
ncbi:MAG: transcriptional repressor NrdR [Deltaproteobacteria bacterium]|nr:transcriptional repressor NrdR [Deltaproteobacteria bacterium]